MNYRKITASISALAILATSIVTFGTTVATAATTFTDASSIASWSSDAVAKLASAGVIAGRPDGSFNPAGNLNRAEIAKIAVLGAKLTTDTTGAPHFNDVAPTDWFYPFVETLYNKGVVGGINNGALDKNGLATFNPAGTLNRAEAAKILVDAFGLEKAYAGTANNFSDVTKGAWYFDYVETAYAHGLVKGYEGGRYGPSDAVTREQIAVIAQNSREEAGVAEGSTAGSKKLATYKAGLASSVATDTTTPTTPVVAASDGTLAVALAAGTPAAATVPAGASSIPVLAVDFTASSAGDVVLSGLTLVKTGVSADSNISNVYLYDGNNRITSGRSITSTNSSVAFNNVGVTIAKGTTKTITVKIDTATSVTSGASYGFKVVDAAAVVSNGKGVTGSFPIAGNIFTASSTVGGDVTVYKNGSLVNPKVGEAGVAISKFKLTAGSAEDITVKQVALLVSGTASTSIIKNAKLYQGGTEIASTTGVNSKDLLVFTPSTTLVIAKGDSRTFEVKADLDTGRTSDTVNVYLDETTDVLAVGNKYGFGVTVTNSDLSTGAQTITLQGGDVTITSNGPSAAKIATNAKDVKLLNFNISSKNQVTFKKFTIKLATSAAENGTNNTNGKKDGLLDDSTANYTDIKVINTKTGATVMGPVDATSLVTTATGTTAISETGTADSTDGAYYTFTDEFTMNANDSLDLALTADVRNSSELADDVVTASTYISSSGTNDRPEIRDVNNKTVTNSSSLVPSSTIDGKGMTVVSDSITLTRASTPVSKTYVKGTNSICFLGTNLKAGDASDIKLTQLKVEGYIDTDASSGTFAAGSEADSGATTRYVKDAVASVSLYDGSTQVGTTKSIQTDGSATFDNLSYSIAAGVTKTLNVCGNFSSSIDTTKITKIAFTISAAANVTAENKDGNSVTATVAAAVNGTTSPSVYMTTANVGTLTVKEEGSPSAAVLVAGATGKTVAKYKISAVNESFLVKKLDLALDTDADFTTASPETTYASSVVSGTISYKNKAGETKTATASFSSGKAQFSNLDLYVPADGNTTVEIKTDLNTISGGATTGDLIKVGIYENTSTSNNSFEATAEGSGTTVNAATSSIFTAAGSVVKTHVLRKTFPTLAKQTAATTLINGESTLYSFSVAADAGAAASFGRVIFDVTTSGGLTNVTDFAFYKGSSRFSDSDVNIYALGRACVDGTDQQDVTTTGAKGLLNARDATDCADATPDGAVDDGTFKVIVSFDPEETISAGASQTYSLKATISGAASGDSLSTRIATGDESTALSGLSAGANTNAQNTGKVYVNATATTGIFTSAATDFAQLVGSNRNIIWSDNASTSHSYPTVAAGSVTTATGSNDFTNGYLLNVTNLSSQTLTY